MGLGSTSRSPLQPSPAAVTVCRAHLGRALPPPALLTRGVVWQLLEVGMSWVRPLGWGPVGTEARPVRTPRPSAARRAEVLLLPQPQAAGAQARGRRACSGPGLRLLMRLSRASWLDLQGQLVGLGARLSSKLGAQVGARQA